MDDLCLVKLLYGCSIKNITYKPDRAGAQADQTVTVFARSDAAATIYFTTQFCAASNREWHLLNSVLLVKSQKNNYTMR